MEKTKMSPRQLMIITSGISYGTAPLVLPSSMAELSGPDVWLSILLGTAIGALFIWIYAKLGELNPDKTFIETIMLYLGKWAGGLVAVFFIIAGLIFTEQIIWYISDFIKTEFAYTLPDLLLNASYVGLLAFALWCGIETMYRTTELLFVFLFPIFIIMTLMLIPNMDLKNLLPVMENGVTPVLKGSIPFMSNCVLPIVFLNMVYPVCFQNVKEAKKALFKGYLLGTFSNLIHITACVLVLGSGLIANTRFAMFLTNEQIDLLVIFSRIEAFSFSIWMGVSFIACFCYAYAGIFGLSQLLKINNYRILIMPMMLLFVIYSDIIYNDVDYELKWDLLTFPPLIFTLGFILPLVLLIASFIKNHSKNRVYKMSLSKTRHDALRGSIKQDFEA